MAVRVANLWTLDIQEEENEFVWDPPIRDRQVRAEDIVYLFEGLQKRTARVALSTKNPLQASARDAASAAATASADGGEGPKPRCDEVDSTARRLVCEVLSGLLGSQVCGFDASVALEGNGLVLVLVLSSPELQGHVQVIACEGDV
ncbi:unnamed protein product [Polarella glacialis]|uniref:Uncharacterized protein n=1 Tax=Polarella glacialis TaxID=89957 RepID=A0A813KMM6_POLGL|nr:unnamed protein product [Polarella glacialis]CAE8708178.1 unnamed protein product [Polarella glacialis]